MCTVICVRTGVWLQDVWCHVQVQAPLKTSSAPLITLTAGPWKKAPRSVATVLPLIIMCAVDSSVYTGSYSPTHSYTRSQSGGWVRVIDLESQPSTEADQRTDSEHEWGLNPLEETLLYTSSNFCIICSVPHQLEQTPRVGLHLCGLGGPRCLGRWNCSLCC